MGIRKALTDDHHQVNLFSLLTKGDTYWLFDSEGAQSDDTPSRISGECVVAFYVLAINKALFSRSLPSRDSSSRRY